MKRYQAILFDLCGTLMLYRMDRLPRVPVSGQIVSTTTPLLYQCFTKYEDHISYERFHHDFVQVTEQVIALRESEGREILSSMRFNLFLDRLHVPHGEARDRLQSGMMQIHLSTLSACMEYPIAHRHLLANLATDYKMGLVTNFDDAETVRSLLIREGIEDLFDAVIISAEMGLRKPHPALFLAAMKGVECIPENTLFVGDSWECDMTGAATLGMDTAWIHMGDGHPVGATFQPNYIVSCITDLAKILKLTPSLVLNS